jgi:hypothetical protein
MPEMPRRRPRPPPLRAAQMQRPAAGSLKVAGLKAQRRPHASQCRTAEPAVEFDGPAVGSPLFLSSSSRDSTPSHFRTVSSLVSSRYTCIPADLWLERARGTWCSARGEIQTNCRFRPKAAVAGARRPHRRLGPRPGLAPTGECALHGHTHCGHSNLRNRAGPG